jgi:hypothetical protein
MPDERRTDKRIPFVNEVEVVGVGVRRCSDLSIGGIYLDTTSFFPEGAFLHLRFKLRLCDENPIEVKARTLHSIPGLGVGLRFVDLSPEDLEKIQKFIDQQ